MITRILQSAGRFIIWLLAWVAIVIFFGVLAFGLIFKPRRKQRSLRYLRAEKFLARQREKNNS